MQVSVSLSVNITECLSNRPGVGPSPTSIDTVILSQPGDLFFWNGSRVGKQEKKGISDGNWGIHYRAGMVIYRAPELG